MADQFGGKKPMPGRGRGLALLQALQKSKPAAENVQPSAFDTQEASVRPKVYSPSAVFSLQGPYGHESISSEAVSLPQAPAAVRTLGRGIPLSLLQRNLSTTPIPATNIGELSKQVSSNTI